MAPELTCLQGFSLGLLWEIRSFLQAQQRLKRIALQTHTHRRAHTCTQHPRCFLQIGMVPVSHSSLPFGEGAQGTRMEGFEREEETPHISAFASSPPSLQIPAGTSPGTKEEFPRLDGHTRRPPHGLRSPEHVPVPTRGYSQDAGRPALTLTQSPGPLHTPTVTQGRDTDCPTVHPASWESPRLQGPASLQP